MNLLMEPFVIIPVSVFDSGITYKEFAVWANLRRFEGASDFAWPSRQELAKRLGVKTAKSVDVCIKSLEERGLLRTFERWRDKDGNIHSEKAPGRTQLSNGYVLFTGNGVKASDFVKNLSKTGGKSKRSDNNYSEPDLKTEPVSKPTTEPEPEPEPEPEQPPILDVDPIAETEEPVHQLATTEPQHNHLPAIAAHEPSNAVQRILRDSVLDTINEPCGQPMNLKKKPSPTTRLQYTPEFEKFWKTYPRRAGGKQNTARAFEWEASQIGSYEPILAGAAQWAKVWDVSGKDMQYCPHPSTWLNQQRYEDDYEQAYTAHVQTLHDSGKSTLLQGTMPTTEARAGMKVMQDLGASPEYVNARRLDPFLDLRD